MTSSTSSSNGAPLLCAVLIIAAIECLTHFCYHGVNKNSPLSFYENDFLIGTNWTKFIMGTKINDLLENDFDYIIVGDSTALHGLIPEIIEETLNKSRFYNAAGFRSLGFKGYTHIAKIAVKKRKTKAIILRLSPTSLKLDDKQTIETKLSRAIKRSYRGLRPFEFLPTGSVRFLFTNFFWDHIWKDQLILSLGNTDSIEPSGPVQKTLQKNRGWLINAHQGEVKTDLCDDQYFEPRHREKVKEHINEFASLLPKSVKLFISFSPISCQQTKLAKEFDLSLKKFFKKSQKVIFLDSLIQTEDKRYFGDDIHSNERGAKVFSENFAKTIKPYLD